MKVTSFNVGVLLVHEQGYDVKFLFSTENEEETKQIDEFFSALDEEMQKRIKIMELEGGGKLYSSISGIALTSEQLNKFKMLVNF